jgi:hypothetical protein
MSFFIGMVDLVFQISKFVGVLHKKVEYGCQSRCGGVASCESDARLAL